MKNILIVCTGNTCRSPVVEGILKKRLKARGLTDWVVHSAGTDARIGEPATEHSVDSVLEFEGIDISQHRARQLSAEDIDTADLILCMAESHRTKINERFGGKNDHSKLLAEMTGAGSVDVVDPHERPRKEYDEMVLNVTDLIDQGLDRVIRMASESAEYKTDVMR